MTRWFLIICVLSMVLPVAGSAQTWQIDPNGAGDAPTIQAGIDSAAAGDTVLLANGTYTGEGNRDIRFRSKAITVCSEAGNPDLCIIDCGGSASDSHTGFLATMGESTGTVLSGVTIQGGYYSNGAAIQITQSAGHGGAPTILDCVFAGNTATSYGGAVYVGNECSPVISGCAFVGNQAGSGGALGVWYGRPPTIAECAFLGNSAAWGGVVNAFRSTLSFSGCACSGNSCTVGGGLMYVQECTLSLADFSSCSNRSKGNWGSLNAWDTNVSIVNCTFTSDSLDGGGLIYLAGTTGSLALEKTIISFCVTGKAVYCQQPSANPAVSCCDIYGNQGGDWVGCIAGKETVNDNISQDPLFCNIPSGDLSNEACSPCLAANNTCGQDIGAQAAAGCGCGEATEPATWGAIKAMYK